MAGQIKTDEMGQFHEYGVYTPARLISLMGDIDEERASEFIKNIRLLDHITDRDITVLISTSGGDVHHGMAIYDAIRECSSHVTTHAVGPCWSMGSVILQAGDVRLVSSSATVMMHLGSEGYKEDHVKIVEQWIKEHSRIETLTQDILLSRIREKKPRYTRAQLKSALLFDTILTAQQAIEWGLADKIETHKGV